ncbi:TonB family protein [Hymenobacter koreensis]|uniref:Energy transducer TonB n=1 Tax=Hymenobacter koreensis TaxID=1084523 RepID=A0ABP8IXP7_9BACT
MQTTTNLNTATLDDIVFEGRNKEYGAYALRRAYDRHLKRALTIAVSLFLLLVMGILAQRYFATSVTIAPPFVHDGKGVVITAIELPKAQPEAQTRAVPRTIPDIATRVAPDKAVADRPKKPDETMAPVEGPTSNLETIGRASVGTGTGMGDSGTVGAGLPPAVITVPKKPEIFISVEVMPEFAGGQQALIEYLQKNLHYPGAAIRAQAEGKVFVSFTVANDGSITDVQVLKGLGYGTDEEAARVIKGMPRWEPGRQNNRPVAVRYTLPISFNMAE